MSLSPPRIGFELLFWSHPYSGEPLMFGMLMNERPRRWPRGPHGWLGWWPHEPHKWLRLSPTGDPLRNPNPKWISNTIPITSNKIPIWKTHFGYPERHNSKFEYPISWRPICRKSCFLDLVIEKTKK
jgi:hypothetical protein